MTYEIPLPEWAKNMHEAPRVTTYVGSEDKAVTWYTRKSRKRYQIDMPDGTFIDLNQQQAFAIAQMLHGEVKDYRD